MKPIEQAIATIVGREPTAEEIAKFYKIKEICGFSEHDSVWAILLAFGHFEILYGQIPDTIATKTRELLAEHKLALEASAGAAEKHIRANLVEAVAKTAKDMADQVIQAANSITRARLIAGIVLGLLASAVTTGVISFVAFKSGERIAEADAAWVQTKEGVAARRFAELNNISAMLDCPSVFMTRQENNGVYCIPYEADSKKNWGWRIK